jgi:hypothetical protein
MDTLHTKARWGWLAALACIAAAGCNDSRPPDFVVEQKSMTLTGAQEVPPVTTAATGNANFSFNLTTGEVKGTMTTTGITGTVAHFHEGPVGVASPVIVPLVQGPPGTWTAPEGSMLTPSQIESYKAGKLYVNVHSAAHPGGEIRAQVGRQIFYATLTQAQETPPTGSAATGTGSFVFDPETKILSGGVTTTGITGVAAHLHTAAIGVAGPITIPMTGGPSSWTLPDNTVLTADQVTTLTSGNFYANVHSAANPGGEIRGQVYVPLRTASMNGAQETPPVTTTATGTCWMMVNPVDKTVAGRIETTLTNGIAAHAHQASTGVPGPVVIPMTSPSPGVWVTAPGATISDVLFAAFMQGNLYCNVHTAANPGGEIRGQLLTPQ